MILLVRYIVQTRVYPAASRNKVVGARPNVFGMTRKPRQSTAPIQTTSLPRLVGVDAIVGPQSLLRRGQERLLYRDRANKFEDDQRRKHHSDYVGANVGKSSPSIQR